MAELTGMGSTVRDVIDALSTESSAAVDISGFGRLLQPRRYGGFALAADEFVSVVFELAVRDGSFGWLAAMCNAAAHDVAGLPEQAAHDVWGTSPQALVAIGHRGSGMLFGGKLTGRWESVVGAEQADWLLLPADSGGRGACRVLVPRARVGIEPVTRPSGLGAAGIRDVTCSALPVDDPRVFPINRGAVIAGAGAAAAVVGSADGVWRTHVDQVRARLATSYAGDEVTNEAAAQVARAASDIDAARLQITNSLPTADVADVELAQRQAVARARGAADRLLGSSRHALDASDAVTHRWRDVHTGCRLAVDLLDHLYPNTGN